MLPPLLTQAEAAGVLRCSIRTVARLRMEGKLPFIRGRPVRIRGEDLARYMEGMAPPAPPDGPPAKETAAQIRRATVALAHLKAELITKNRRT